MLTRKGKIVFILMTLLLVVSALLLLITEAFLKEELADAVLTFGVSALFIFTFLFDFLPQFISPKLVLIAAILSGFDPFTAVLTTIIGTTFGSIFAFEVGHHYGRDYVEQLIDRRHEKQFERIVHEYGRWGVLISAVTLLYMPIIVGAVGISRKVLWIYGILPRIFIYIIIGLFPYIFYS